VYLLEISEACELRWHICALETEAQLGVRSDRGNRPILYIFRSDYRKNLTLPPNSSLYLILRLIPSPPPFGRRPCHVPSFAPPQATPLSGEVKIEVQIEYCDPYHDEEGKMTIVDCEVNNG